MTARTAAPEPFLAGTYDTRNASAEARRTELTDAFAAQAPVMVTAYGPLTLATHGIDAWPELSAGLPVCVLDGVIHNLDHVAELAGLTAPAGAPNEVLAHAYSRLGHGVLGSLRGDFVVVLWDARSRQGVIVTDQLGARSLVWHDSGGRLLFASDVRHLLAVLPRTPGPDPAALAHWISNSFMRGDNSLYEGIRRLPGGHLLRYADGAWDVQRYWQPRYKRPLRASRAELVERLRDALERSVARRSPDGASTGVLLSGGLDSSSVAAVGARLPHRHRIDRAYSATFPEHPTVDESQLIECLCETFNLRCTRAVVRGGSVLGGALPYLAHWRLPPVSPNLFFWAPLLERAAADGISVMLDGEGGDEVFGYAPTLLADRIRRGRLLAARKLLYRLPGPAGPPSPGDVRRAAPAIVREYGLRAAAPHSLHRLSRGIRRTSRYAPDWFHESTSRAFVGSNDPSLWKKAAGPRWWAHIVDATTSGMAAAINNDHTRRRAASAGLRTTHPLRDLDVVELVLSFPPELAFDNRWNRPLLREAMTGLLPDEVRLRPAKSTFDAIFHDALTGPDLPIVRELLTAPNAELRAYADLDALEQRLLAPPVPTHPRARSRWAVQVWRLVTAEWWLRMLADGGFPGRLLEQAQFPAAQVQIESGDT